MLIASKPIVHKLRISGVKFNVYVPLLLMMVHVHILYCIEPQFCTIIVLGN